MNRRTLGLLGALVCLLALLPTAPAHGTTVLHVDLAQLVDQADGIFTGTAVYSEVAVSGDGLMPFTFVTFQVDSALKGSFPGREVTLRFEGGETDQKIVVVQGMPHFEVGERYLVFVSGNGVYGCPIFGWTQGQFRFAREALSGSPMLVDWRGAPVLGIDHGRFRKAPPQRLALRDAALPEITVLSEEGVEVEPVAPKVTAAPQDIPAAEQVVSELASFVRGRTGKPSFVPGRAVRSADPADVPERIGAPAPPPWR